MPRHPAGFNGNVESHCQGFWSAARFLSGKTLSSR
jgi:hypothetical protein